jgi:hypothetical protein
MRAGSGFHRANIIRLIFFLVFFVFATGAPDVTSAKTTCGGEGQSPCAYAKATSKGALKVDCGKGAFLDPREGGQCWS